MLSLHRKRTQTHLRPLACPCSQAILEMVVMVGIESQNFIVFMVKFKARQVLTKIKLHIKESSQEIPRPISSRSSDLVGLVKGRWRLCMNALAIRSAGYGRLLLLRWRHLKSGLESLYLVSLGAIAPWVLKLKSRVPPMDEEQKRTIFINGRSLLRSLLDLACSEETLYQLQAMYQGLECGHFSIPASTEGINYISRLIWVGVYIIVPICKMLVASIHYLRNIDNKINR